MTAPSLGWLVLSWIEHYLVHGPGDIQGQPVRLDDELAGFLLDAYELRPAGSREGRRRYRRVFFSRPKGRAKSELAGMVGCAEALAPVRFAGWAEGGETTHWGYVYQPGEPLGRPVTYPFIRCLATEESQAGNTYDNMAYMLHPDTCSDRLREDYPGIDAGRDWQTSTRIYFPDGGEVRPSTASNASKDGGKETFVVADETHLYTINETRGMHATVQRNLAKRKAAEPWMLETSTMYAPGQDSIAERTHAAHLKRPDGSILFDHRQASKSLGECSGIDDIIECLREAYGDFADVIDLRPLAEDILDGTVEDPERYFFNRPTSTADAWCDVREWDARSILSDGTVKPIRHGDGVERGPLPPDGLRVTLGFDGSEGTSDKRIPDSTVLRGVVLQEGDWHGYRFTVGVWEADGDSDWVPPWTEVDATVDWAFGRWDVWRAYCDPRGWRDWIRGWQHRHGDDRVLEWETYRDRQMASALGALHAAITTDDSGLSHDGDPRASAHYGNARKHIKRARSEQDDPESRKELILVRKETPRSALKIDIVVADALAGEAFGDGIASGAHRIRRSRAWGF